MNTTRTETSLYQRVGGATAVAALVDRFYLRVMADPNLLPYFDHAALDKLRRMQREFFTAALGGPIRYSGRPIIHAHHGRGITREHFQAFVEHMLATLAGYGLDENDRYTIIARLNTYADEVVRPGGAVE